MSLIGNNFEPKEWLFDSFLLIPEVKNFSLGADINIGTTMRGLILQGTNGRMTQRYMDAGVVPMVLFIHWNDLVMQYLNKNNEKN